MYKILVDWLGIMLLIVVLTPFYLLVHKKFREEPRRKKYEQEVAEREQELAKHEQELAKRRWEAGSKDRELAREQVIKDFSLNCEECGALAAPIPSTNNRYRCKKCGRQFASSPHPI